MGRDCGGALSRNSDNEDQESPAIQNNFQGEAVETNEETQFEYPMNSPYENTMKKPADNNNNYYRNNLDYSQKSPNVYGEPAYPYERPSNTFSNSYEETNRTDETNMDEEAGVEDFCFEMPTAAFETYRTNRDFKNYWFYDARDRECKLFTTDADDTNRNKFSTIETCEIRCLQPHMKLEELENKPRNDFDEPGFYSKRSSF